MLIWRRFDLPLRRCGNACRDFEEELIKCSSRSGGSRTSFRDWAKLRYMGDDMDSLKRLLSGYKMAINIAHTHTGLHKFTLTAEGLVDYQNLIDTAHEDLQAHLKNIDERLDSVITQTLRAPTPNPQELKVIQDERLSALRCLQICEQLSQQIDRMQLTMDDDEPPVEELDKDKVSQRITREGLEACKDSLHQTAARLESHMKDVTHRIIQKSKAGVASRDDVSDLERLQDEWDATRESVKLCSLAGAHLANNVSRIENHDTGDSVQFMVSTSGQVIHGKNHGMGWKNRQVGGHMSDAIVLQLSKDMAKDDLRTGGPEEHALRSKGSPVPDSAFQKDRITNLEDRYGTGFKLGSTSLADKANSTAARPNIRYHRPNHEMSTTALELRDAMTSSLNTWTKNVKDDEELPESSIQIAGLIRRVPKYLEVQPIRPFDQYMVTHDESGNAWVESNSTWSTTSEGRCRLPDKLLPHRMLLGTSSRIEVTLTAGGPFQDWPGVLNVEPPKQGNCIAILRRARHVLEWYSSGLDPHRIGQRCHDLSTHSSPLSYTASAYC